MSIIQVDSLQFNFERTIAPERYETWHHYTAVWNAAGGQKAVDVVAIENPAAPTTTWLIEAKDFRVITNPPRPSNIAGLADTVRDKVMDSLAGLVDAARNATAINEKNYATSAMSAPTKRVVLPPGATRWCTHSLVSSRI
jgi:hypothetical protein